MTLYFLYDLTPLLRVLFNMSLTAGYIVVAVLLLRLCLKKAPRALTCLLWGVVGLRLLLPIRFESILSLIPSKEPLPSDFLTSDTPQLNTGFSEFNSTMSPIIQDSLPNAVGDIYTPMEEVFAILALFWLLGLAAMLIYATVSYVRVRLQVREAVRLAECREKNVYICDRVPSPFILGLIRPKIYLPSSISERDREYVIAHERAHLRRLDHIWKPLGFLLLSVYWFNPLLWVAYILLCRDIELACDEKVLRAMGGDAKASYSEALLNCASPRRLVTACPLAFGEVGVKARIKSVLNYKKPAFWIIAVALVASIVLAVCFLTDPKEKYDLYIENDKTASDFGGEGEIGTAELVWTAHDEGERKIGTEDFPKVTFIIDNSEVKFEAFGKTATLFSGMPIDVVYFCDINRDGKRDICAVVSIGSGLIDQRVIVFDFANMARYEISDRSRFDYGLRVKDNKLVLTEREYYSYDTRIIGTLTIDLVLKMADNFFDDNEDRLDFPTDIYAGPYEFDIDNDGATEIFTLTPGITYGITTFILNVKKNGHINRLVLSGEDWLNDFNLYEKSGKLYISCRRRVAENIEGNFEVRYVKKEFLVRYVDGEIQVFDEENGKVVQEIFVYG